MSASIRHWPGRTIVRRSGEEAPRAARAVLESAGVGSGSRTTCRSACVATPSSASSADEARVRALVVDDEAGVDLNRPARRVNRDGLDVAAGLAVLLEDRHLMLGTERVGRGEPADPGTDDRDVHGATAPVARWSSASRIPSRAATSDARERAAGKRTREPKQTRPGGCPRCSRSASPPGIDARTGSRRRPRCRARARRARPAGTARTSVTSYSIGATRPPMRTPRR